MLKIQYNDKPPTYPNDRFDPSAKYRRELQFLSKHPFRNNIISKLSEKFDNNCLLLVDYIEHGEELYGILKSTCKNKQVFFIRGDLTFEDSEEVK